MTAGSDTRNMRLHPAFDKAAAMNNAVSCRNTMPPIHHPCRMPIPMQGNARMRTKSWAHRGLCG